MPRQLRTGRLHTLASVFVVRVSVHAAPRPSCSVAAPVRWHLLPCRLRRPQPWPNLLTVASVQGMSSRARYATANDISPSTDVCGAICCGPRTSSSAAGRAEPPIATADCSACGFEQRRPAAQGTPRHSASSQPSHPALRRGPMLISRTLSSAPSSPSVRNADCGGCGFVRWRGGS